MRLVYHYWAQHRYDCLQSTHTYIHRLGFRPNVVQVLYDATGERRSTNTKTRLRFQEWPGTPLFTAMFFFIGAAAVCCKWVYVSLCAYGESLGVNHQDRFCGIQPITGVKQAASTTGFSKRCFVELT